MLNATRKLYLAPKELNLQYCCHIWCGALAVYLEIDKIQRICNVIGPDQESLLHFPTAVIYFPMALFLNIHHFKIKKEQDADLYMRESVFFFIISPFARQ